MTENNPSSPIIDEINSFLKQLKRELPEIFNKEDEKPAPVTPSIKAYAPLDDNAPKVLYMGKMYNYRIDEDPEIVSEVFIEDNTINVILGNTKEMNANKVLEEWLRTSAEDTLAEKVDMWADKMGVEYNRVSVKDQKTLWGSCSSNKNLNFSWRIIKAPEHIIDYLVIHELSHLVHMNHGPDFWNMVQEFCPDYKVRRQWLKSFRGDICPQDDSIIPEDDL